MIQRPFNYLASDFHDLNKCSVDTAYALAFSRLLSDLCWEASRLRIAEFADVVGARGAR